MLQPTNLSSTCPKCGALLQRGGHLAGQCLVCLLESALDEEEVPTASAERFDHYQVATHADGTPVELGRGAMGVTFKAFDTILGMTWLSKSSREYLGPPNGAGTFPARSPRRRAASAPERRLGLLLRGRKSDEQCFYAMEFVEGETLEDLVRRSGRLQLPLALGNRDTGRHGAGCRPQAEGWCTAISNRQI